jgi:hypothetical protein
VFILKTHDQLQKNILIAFKKTKFAFACFSAEPPSQRASDETRFFNTTRAPKRNLLAGFLAHHDPRALVSFLVILS